MLNGFTVINKTQSKAWLEFLGHNAEVIWDMDCNDDVKDVLMGYMLTSNHASNFSSDTADIFEASYRCPYRMRDLYQLVNKITKACPDPVDRFRTFQGALGHLRSGAGLPFDFTYLLPEEYFEMPFETDWFDEGRTDESEVPF